MIGVVETEFFDQFIQIRLLVGEDRKGSRAELPRDQIRGIGEGGKAAGRLEILKGEDREILFEMDPCRGDQFCLKTQ